MDGPCVHKIKIPIIWYGNVLQQAYYISRLQFSVTTTCSDCFYVAALPVSTIL